MFTVDAALVVADGEPFPRRHVAPGSGGFVANRLTVLVAYIDVP